MFPYDITEKHGFAVTTQDADGNVSTWYGTAQEADAKWTDNDFHRERLGKKRGWDPVGTFVYDSIESFQMNNNHHPKTLAFRREFYKTTVIVTEARKKGDEPWRSSVDFFDLPAREEVRPELTDRAADKYAARLKLVEEVQLFLATGGSAQAYSNVVQALEQYQTVDYAYSSSKSTLCYHDELAEAEEGVRLAAEKLERLKTKK